jgi:hypothetical protein
LSFGTALYKKRPLQTYHNITVTRTIFWLNFLGQPCSNSG